MKNTTAIRKLGSLIAVFCLASLSAFAQKPKATAYTKAQARMEGFDTRKSLKQTALTSALPIQNVGPHIMSGRVVDLAVNDEEPTTFYVAYASGGLWKTENNGLDFVPLFDDQASMTIGDIAVDWENNETIWVGTGENNSSRSSYAGTGMYKSTDGGKSWEHLGLEETHHIGRVVLHPSDSNTVWVAALGHLYSDNPERGVYKTTDGGQNWEKVLFVNDSTGFVDLVIHPNDPKTLYATAWERRRAAWDFKGSGEGSGIYKSTDGGNSWTKLNTSSSGFPNDAGVGRIGLAIAPSNPKMVYAVLDNQSRREKEKGEDGQDAITKNMLRDVSKEDFLAMTDEAINGFLDRYNFPRNYNAAEIKSLVKNGEVRPIALVEYLEDANSLLFDTPVKGAEMYVSTNGGKNWKKTHDGYIDDLVYSYGYYFGQVRVDPQNDQHIYTMGVPLIKSEDGGKTWKNISGPNVHADHHALWINPKNSGHLINGNDGGVNITYDDGKQYFKANTLPVGQFYSVNVDMAKPYNIYGGLQDNGVWYGPNNYSASNRWNQTGKYPYQSIMGGDGMQVAIDTRDNNTIYTGYQFGNYFRLNKETGEQKYITPKHNLGERPYRWNWQAPIHLSVHNQDVVYFGSNHFHRSLNQGDDFQKLSGDLTKGGRKGNVPYGTLTSIHESPLKFGLVYVGSDDGLVHVTKDGGYTWERISDDLPQDFWVSRVQASKHVEGRVYVSLNGYRTDNFEPLVYMSDNFGRDWTRVGTGLPKEPVNVVKEDPVNENILYVGTDHSAYISFDMGKSFMPVSAELPAVPVHDLVIHPRENHLILGTHGRSFYKMDVGNIQRLTPENLNKQLHIFAIDGNRYNARWGQKPSYNWGGTWEPKTTVAFFAKEAGTATVKVMSGLEVFKEMEIEVDKGLNYFDYDFTIDAKKRKAYQKWLEGNDKKGELKEADNGHYYLQPGKYGLSISMGNTSTAENFEVKAPRKRPARTAAKRTP